MSDKRFYITDTGLGLDTVSDEMYSFGDEEDFYRLFDKLNEQQATITELNGELEESSAFIIEQRKEIQTLKEENEKLIQEKCFPCELVNLQTREIDKLKKENEQLRNKLEVANARSGYYQRMLKKWCVK